MTGVGSRVVRALAIVAATLALVTPAAAGDGTAGGERRGVPPWTAKHARWAGAAGVSGWIDVLLDEVARRPLSPPRVARALALTSVAMRDAVNCRVREPGCSKLPSSALAAGAAGTVLRHLFPARAGSLARLTREAATPAGSARQAHRGIALGRLAGRQMVARARADGSDRIGPVVVPDLLGAWVPTPPAFSPPLEPLAGSWRPWALRRAGQFRPAPPPPYGGPTHLAQALEVLEVARTLTPEQRAIALRWNDGAGTDTPAGHWNRIAIDLIERARHGPRRAARVLALLNAAQADAFIACWEAKYQYWTRRPVTVIRDWLDADFSPLIPTPPFPAYPSGHATTSAAAATVLGRLFPARALALDRLADKAAASRVYGGIHFHVDAEAGLTLGRRVGLAALAAFAR
jgi:PAP2 superfamily